MTQQLQLTSEQVQKFIEHLERENLNLSIQINQLADFIPTGVSSVPSSISLQTVETIAATLPRVVPGMEIGTWLPPQPPEKKQEVVD